MKKKDQEAMHNGHKNWSFWNVALWLDNDEALYSMVQEALNRCKTKKQAAYRLYEALKREKTPDGARYTLGAIKAALGA